jgi:hypothetical protein
LAAGNPEAGTRIADGISENGASKEQLKTVREWLEYAVEQVPKLYKMNIEVKDTPAMFSDRGITITKPALLSLQTPSLFDFRADQDHGIALKTIR